MPFVVSFTPLRITAHDEMHMYRERERERDVVRGKKDTNMSRVGSEVG